MKTRVWGSVTREAQWPISPRTTGRGIAAPPPVDAAGQSVNIAGGWACETARSGRVSGAVAHVLKQGLKSDGGGRDCQPVSGRRVREIHRPTNRPTSRVVSTFDVCCNAAVNSDLSCFLYRGRLKRSHLHCRASYRLDLPLSFVSRHPCIWYMGHGEANKRSTDSKRSATGGNNPAHNGPISGQSLVLILGSGEIPFLGLRKKIETRDSRVLLTSLIYATGTPINLLPCLGLFAFMAS